MYRILDEAGRSLEGHERLLDAEKAYWALRAHEQKNGRLAMYTITGVPPERITPWNELELHAWVVQEFTAHGVMTSFPRLTQTK